MRWLRVGPCIRAATIKNELWGEAFSLQPPPLPQSREGAGNGVNHGPCLHSGLHKNSNRALGPQPQVSAGGGIRGSDKESIWQPGGAVEGMRGGKGTECPAAPGTLSQHRQWSRDPPIILLLPSFLPEEQSQHTNTSSSDGASNSQQPFFHCSSMWTNSANRPHLHFTSPLPQENKKTLLRRKHLKISILVPYKFPTVQNSVTDFLITWTEVKLLVLSLHLQLPYCFSSSLTFSQHYYSPGRWRVLNCSINPHLSCLHETGLGARYLYHCTHLLMGQ